MTGSAHAPLVVASFPKNSIERVVIRLDHYQGTATIHIRTEYRADNEWLAAKQGMALALHHLPALADGLQRALSMALETGRLTGA
jgi:hypothetical protein